MAHPLTLLLEAHLAQGMGTAAAYAVSERGKPVASDAIGALSPGGPAPTASTRFDIASVTKLVTTTLAAILTDQARLQLDAPVEAVLGPCAVGSLTARQLLGHRSGLEAWQPLFELVRRDPQTHALWQPQPSPNLRTQAREALLRAACDTTPTPSQSRVYSDLGFLVLTALIEAIAGERLDGLTEAWIARPLGLSLGYRPLSHATSEAIPATGLLRPRPPAPGQEGRYLVPAPSPRLDAGEVDDDNAWAMDGVSGHAGVFSNAGDLVALGGAWLDAFHGRSSLFSQVTAQHFLAIDAPGLRPERSLGFDRPAPTGSTLGTKLGRGPQGAVGHLGFTGTSLWIDLDHDLVVALLTNRTFPDRTARDPIRACRIAFHDELASCLGL